jgi:predicted RecA/RadA family phage recombinase
MAKNYVCDGKAVSLPAPAGGVVSGVPAKIGALVVIPINSAAEGEQFTGQTDGVWRLPAATGLTVGALVKWDSDTGKLVADSAKDGDDFGKLFTAESGGYAEALLSN